MHYILGCLDLRLSIPPCLGLNLGSYGFADYDGLRTEHASAGTCIHRRAYHSVPEPSTVCYEPKIRGIPFGIRHGRHVVSVGSTQNGLRLSVRRGQRESYRMLIKSYSYGVWAGVTSSNARFPAAGQPPDAFSPIATIYRHNRGLEAEWTSSGHNGCVTDI